MRRVRAAHGNAIRHAVPLVRVGEHGRCCHRTPPAQAAAAEVEETALGRMCGISEPAALGVALSPADGGDVAAIGQVRDGFCLIVDGKADALYDRAGEHSVPFSPDGKCVMYVAFRGDRSLTVANGQEGPKYREVLSQTLSLSQTHLRYLAIRGDSNLVRVTQKLAG